MSFFKLGEPQEHNQVRAVVESMNILSTFQNCIYFQVDSNLLFSYTHLPSITHLTTKPLGYARLEYKKENSAYNLQLLQGRARIVWAPCNREFLNFMPIYDSD